MPLPPSQPAPALLDRQPPPGYREEWTRRIAAERPRSEQETQPVVAFRCGAEWFALPVTAFREIVPLRPVHSIPHRRNRVVEGVVNHHGELLLCIRLGVLLGVGEAEPAPGLGWERLVVVGRERQRVAFRVDEVRAGLEYAPSELRPVPLTVALASAPCALGLWLWEGRSVGMLYEPHFLEAIDRSLA